MNQKKAKKLRKLSKEIGHDIPEKDYEAVKNQNGNVTAQLTLSQRKLYKDMKKGRYKV